MPIQVTGEDDGKILTVNLSGKPAKAGCAPVGAGVERLAMVGETNWRQAKATFYQSI